MQLRHYAHLQKDYLCADNCVNKKMVGHSVTTTLDLSNIKAIPEGMSL